MSNIVLLNIKFLHEVLFYFLLWFSGALFYELLFVFLNKALDTTGN